MKVSIRKSSESTSIKTTIYNQLRESILSAEFKPGQMLSENDLASKLMVSRTPVREALIWLSHEGLVNIYPQRGTFVSFINKNEVIQSQFIRESLEVAAVERLIENVTQSQLQQLQDNIEAQRICSAIKDYREFYEFDEAFHNLIATMSGYPLIWDVIRSIKIQMDRVRRITLPDPSRINRLILEHQNILDAVKKRDPKLAAKNIRIHTRAVLETVNELADKLPDYII